MSDLFQGLVRFGADIELGQRGPNRKWIRSMLAGMLMAGAVRLTDIGRALRERDCENRRRKLNHVEKRLSRGLSSDRLDDEELKARACHRAAELTRAEDGAGVVMAVDYSDLSKPRARPHRPQGMELVCQCWDGSAGTSGMGYPLVVIQASLPSGTSFPLVLQPFSFASPGFASQNEVMVDAIAQVEPYVGDHAVWVFDRGFDAHAFFVALDDLGVRWVVRLKAGRNARHLWARGAGAKVGEVADTVRLTQSLDVPSWGLVRVGWLPVQLLSNTGGKGPQSRQRTLIVVEMSGGGRLCLLAHNTLTGDEVGDAVAAYQRRWTAETSIRALKDTRGWGPGLEDVRALSFRGVCRIALLVSMLMLFLAEVREANDAPAMEALAAVQVLKEQEAPEDLTYRLFRGAGEALRDVPLEHLHAWIKERTTGGDDAP